MNVEDEEWVQHALMDFERKRCISKVLSIDRESAVPKGNNYGSDLYRLKMKTVLYSGDVVTKSFIYKALPATEFRRQIIKHTRHHIKESRIYTEVLPQMEKLRREKDADVVPLSPICYGIKKGNEAFLLEDLIEKGYKLADRENGLDFLHAVVAIKALAEFHALSMVLVEQGDLVADDFRDDDLAKNVGHIAPMMLQTLALIADTIEQEWKGELLKYVEKIRELSRTAVELFLEGLKFDGSNVNVLIHGDFWTTNMLFHYNSEGLPQSIRFIDFQQSSYKSIAMELQYFFNTSLNAETLTRRGELIQIYYDSLVSTLSKLGLSEKAPSLKEVLASYEKGNLLGLVLGLTIRPLLVQPSESVPDDLEQMTKEMFNEEEKKIPKPDLRNVKSILLPLLEHATSVGIL